MAKYHSDPRLIYFVWIFPVQWLSIIKQPYKFVTHNYIEQTQYIINKVVIFHKQIWGDCKIIISDSMDNQIYLNSHQLIVIVTFAWLEHNYYQAKVAIRCFVWILVVYPNGFVHKEIRIVYFDIWLSKSFSRSIIYLRLTWIFLWEGLYKISYNAFVFTFAKNLLV